MTTVTKDPETFYRKLDQSVMADTMRRIAILLDEGTIDGFCFEVNHRGETHLTPTDFKRICQGAEVEHRGKHGDSYFVSRAEKYGVKWVCKMLKPVPSNSGLIIINEVV